MEYAINGQPAVRFDGVDDVLMLPDVMNAATAGEVFMVMRLQDFSRQTYNNFLDLAAGDQAAKYTTDLVINGFGINGEIIHSRPNNPTTVTVPHVFNSSISNAGVQQLRINGALEYSQTGFTVGFRPDPKLGNNNYSNGFYGDIAEVIIFDRVLSQAERDAVGLYFATKYGVGIVDETPPSAPSGLSASNLAATSFTLSWTAATDNLVVTAYDIYRDGQLAGSVSGSTLTYNVTGLTPVTTYTMTVKARDGSGNTSPASTSLDVTTLADTTAPTVPTGLSATGIGSVSVTLAWGTSTDDVAVTAYDLYRDGAHIGTSTATTYQATGLAINQTYQFTVRARDAAGNASAQGSALSVTTVPDLTAPTAPANLIANANRGTSVELAWAAATDNVGVTAYEIYRNTQLIGTVSGSTLLYTATGLSTNTAYTFTVRAKDESGNTSPDSTPLLVTTEALPATLAGLRLWLKADSGPVADTQGHVSTWLDRSPTGNHATQTESAKRPQVVANTLNGQPVIRFDGAHALNLPDFIAGSPAGEIIALIKVGDKIPGQYDNNNNEPWSFGIATGYYRDQPNSTIYYHYNGFGRSNTQENDFGFPISKVSNYHLFNTSSDGTVWAERFNGVMHRTANNMAVGFSQNPILGNGFVGDIVEVLVFNRVLTPTERDSIHTYLTAKYAPPGIVVPATPTLAAYAATGTRADLSWSAASPTAQRQVATLERKTGNGAYAPLVSLDNAYSYTDTGLTPGETYTYRVTLTSYAGTSAFSNPATVILPLNSPEVPTAGLLVWLRASTQGPGPVSAWLDQSGQANDATQLNDPNRRPILVVNALNGQPAIRFSGEQSLNLPNFIAGSPAGEIIALLKVGDKTPGQYSNNNNDPWDFGIPTGYYRDRPTSPVYYHYNGFGRSNTSENDASFPISKVSSYHIYNISNDGAVWAERYNGLVHRTANNMAVGFSQNPVLGDGFVGDIAEIIIYNRVLTDAERLLVKTSLATKYTPPGIYAPPAPTLYLGMASWRRVDLKWTIPAVPSSYYVTQVERQTENGPFVLLNESPAGIARYEDRTASPGLTYTYRVRFKGYVNASAYSDTVSVTVPTIPSLGLKLALNAKNLSPGPVASWSDESGLGNNAVQPDSSRQPTAINNSLIRFDGVNDSLNLPDLLSGKTEGEIIAVVKTNPLTGKFNRLWSFGATNTGSSYYNTARHEDFGTDSARIYTGSTLATQTHIESISIASGILTARVNNVINWTGAVAATGFSSTPVIGGSATDPNIVFNGDIYALYVYDRELTDTERLQLLSGLEDAYPLSFVNNPDLRLSASSTTPDEVHLSWNPPDQSYIYAHIIIERKVGSGAFSVLAETDARSSYVDNTVQPLTDYTYRIRSVGIDRSTPFSNVVTVRPAAALISLPQTTKTGSALIPATGSWTIQDTRLVANSMRGSVDYNYSITQAGLYAVQIQVSKSTPASGSGNFEFEVYVDGVFVKTISISAWYNSAGTGSAYLPWLNVGNHTVKFLWRNGDKNSLVIINKVELSTPGNADLDANGEADWITSLLNGNFVFDQTSTESYVSPYFTEGKSSWPKHIDITATAQTTPLSPIQTITTQEGLLNSFYAEVPLHADAITQVQVKEAGGLRTVTKNIEWKAFNLNELTDYAVMIKKDSRLLVEAPAPSGGQEVLQYELKVTSPTGQVTTTPFTSSQKLNLLFDLPGVYLMDLIPGGQSARRVMSVSVRSADLGAMPVLFQNSSNLVRWTPPSLAADSLVQTDTTLTATELAPSSPRSFDLSARGAGRLVVRIGDEHSPILAAGRIDPIRSYQGESSTLQKVSTLPDGTAVYRAVINLEGNIPPGLTIELNTFQPGAVFEDGSTTKSITAANLDASGRYSYFIYRATPGSNCHNVGFYMNGNPIFFY